MNPYQLGLREAFDDELESIIENAQKYLPHSETVYSFLVFSFRRRIVDRKKTRMYVPAAENLPFFIIITNVLLKPGRQTLTPFWDLEEISTEDAKLLFKSLPDWNWEEVMLFNNASLHPLREAEKILLGENGLCKNKLQISRLEGYTYKIIDENNINIKPLGDNIFLSNIDESYAPLVYKHWGYTFDTIEGVKLYMRFFPAVAAFTKKEPSEEPDEWDLTKVENGIVNFYKPVCWVLCRAHGEIGFTYTVPEYRNKGLAAAVTIAVAKQVKKLNLSPYVNIIIPNPSSEKFHFNAGFRKTGDCAYHMYLLPGMSWDDF